VPYRIFVALIVGFWLVMSGLLVQLELNPKRSEMLTVPPAYVFGLMFVHGEESALNVFDNGTRAGHLSLRPSMMPDEKLRELDFSGSISIKLPMANKQRFIFDGHAEMDRKLQLHSLHFNVTMREPALRAQIDIDARQRVRYELMQGREVIRGELNAMSPDLPPETGIDPAAFQTLRQNMASATMSARRTEFKVRDEKTSAYLITLDYGTTTLAEIYVSELGQILLAKTAGGYTVSAEDKIR
jgi:hypothetical protein